jgi:hypothetical protein
MQRHLFVPLVCALAGVAVALPLTMGALRTDAGRRAPESLAEVAEVAVELGLFYRYDGPAAQCCLIISATEMPTTSPPAPRMNNPTHPFWFGTVAIYTRASAMLANYDPACSLVWGTLFVYGDPDLIAKLTGRRP